MRIARGCALLVVLMSAWGAAHADSLSIPLLAEDHGTWHDDDRSSLQETWTEDVVAPLSLEQGSAAPQPAAVTPEPSSLLLLGTGALSGMVFVLRKRGRVRPVALAEVQLPAGLFPEVGAVSRT